MYGLDEVPRDSAVNCRAYCNKLYLELLQKSLYYQACIGICASMIEYVHTAVVNHSPVLTEPYKSIFFCTHALCRRLLKINLSGFDVILTVAVTIATL